ncbi:NADP-dependent oxidoreductase [uncultured Shewanella sp.]|uniref:NADP-dependent oxidoreductase n=1 Tax=uncultured Shewanella sp. TaxID=173975 RepID=UPI002607B2FC|nr:NADP-dependent oxidoreductase [uncultured Shewanella sp.]
MKALRMTQYGDIETSLAFQEMAIPQPADNEILVKVHAASINPIDSKILRGDFKALKKIEFPAGIGRDVSGEVIGVGIKVTEYQIGDDIFARVSEEHVGTLAEFMLIDAAHVAKKPQNLSYQEAASIPLVGLTSYQAMLQIGMLKQGEKVLIHAGSGGIGSMAIQLAKSVGAYVITTTSTANVPWVKALGADRVIDYKKTDYLDLLTGIDLVYDTLGGQYTLDAFKVIKLGGRVVSIAGELDPQTTKMLGLNWVIRTLLGFKSRMIMKAAKKKSALYRMVLMQANGEQLKELKALYQDNVIQPVIDKHYAFKDSKSALSYLNSGRAKGKVVISLLND